MNFVEKTLQFVGAPYTPQGFSKIDGYDCFSLVINFMREQGFTFPKDMKWRGITFDSYYKLWETDQKLAVNTMIKFFEEVTKRIELAQLAVGDILIVQNTHTDVVFCAIYGGNDKIITSDMKYGVIGLPIRHFRILDMFGGSK